jgi:Skp family chaperone for outer membrane proteins
MAGYRIDQDQPCSLGSPERQRDPRATVNNQIKPYEETDQTKLQKLERDINAKISALNDQIAKAKAENRARINALSNCVPIMIDELPS